MIDRVAQTRTIRIRPVCQSAHQLERQHQEETEHKDREVISEERATAASIVNG
jgi:hypothetical protein